MFAVFNQETFQEGERVETETDLRMEEDTKNELNASNTDQTANSDFQTNNSISWIIGVLLIAFITGLVIFFT